MPEERIPITNDFMFNRVMRNPKICKGVLQDILPEIDIGRIEYVQTQKSLDENLDTHGIRLDVYAKSSDKVYNIEMQRADVDDLAKRARYYQSHIDMDILGKGEDYETLKESYVIFICTFDPFGHNQYIYPFENQCRELPELLLKDETYKIFVNTKGTKGNISDDLKALIDYFENRENQNPTTLVEEIEHEVQIANKDADWRRKMLSFEMKLRDEHKIGVKEGLAQGMAQGMERGIEEERYRMALALLETGHPLAFIEELTKLPKEEIMALQEDKNKA